MQTFKRGIYETTTDVAAQLEGGLGASIRGMVDAFAKARTQLDLVNPDQGRRSRIAQEAMESAREDLAEIIANERAITEAAMASERRKYERDAQLNADNYSRQFTAYQRRMDALSNDELSREAIQVMGGAKVLRPEEIDLLSAALKKSDPAIHDDFRKEVASKGLYEPWRFSESGQLIDRYLTTVKLAEKHGGEVPVRDPDGRCYNVLLSTLVEPLDSNGGDL